MLSPLFVEGTYVTDFDNIRIKNDGMVFTIAIVPAGFVAPDDKRWKFQIVPSATYDRYKKSGKHLGPEISQKVARLALVVHTACEIFQDTRKARDFLNRPHPLLKGKAPIELALTNESGARAVNDIMIAGAYGGGA